MQLEARLQQLQPCDQYEVEIRKRGGLLILLRLHLGLIERLVGEQQLQMLRAIVHDYAFLSLSSRAAPVAATERIKASTV
jgi:hypothetical protein